MSVRTLNISVIISKMMNIHRYAVRRRRGRNSGLKHRKEIRPHFPDASRLFLSVCLLVLRLLFLRARGCNLQERQHNRSVCLHRSRFAGWSAISSRERKTNCIAGAPRRAGAVFSRTRARNRGRTSFPAIICAHTEISGRHNLASRSTHMCAALRGRPRGKEGGNANADEQKSPFPSRRLPRLRTDKQTYPKGALRFSSKCRHNCRTTEEFYCTHLCCVYWW